MKEKKMRPFGARDQWGYMFGEVGNNFMFFFMESYFLTFCTYALGLSPYFMGTLFLFARIWDAINDPIIGSFSDRWKLGKGKERYKPFIRLSIVPAAVATMFCYMDVSSWQVLAKHVWVAVIYVLYGMCYTSLTMPYGSLSSVVTEDSIERAKLSRARGMGGLLIVIPSAIAPMFLFDSEGAVSKSGFRSVAIVFGCMAILCYLLLLKLTQERVEIPPREEKFEYGKVLKSATKNRALIGVMIAAFGAMFATTGTSAIGTYMFKEYYQNPQLLAIQSMVALPITLILFPIVPRVEKKMGKRKFVVGCASLSFVVSMFLFLVPLSNPYLYICLNLLGTLGNSVLAMFLWAIVNDSIDYQEYLTNERNTGSIYSIFSFSRKFGATCAAALGSYALGWVGYQSALASQSAEVAGRIRYLCTSIPVISATMILVGMGLVYNLSKQDSAKISQELIEKHAAERAASEKAEA